MTHASSESDAPPPDDASHDTRRRCNQQVREVVGPLDDELMDEIDYEREFETFEPIKEKRGRR